MIQEIKDTLFWMKEYWTWKEWRRLLLCVLAVLCVTGYLVYRHWRKEQYLQKLEMQPFYMEYSGYQWKNDGETEPIPVSVVFDGTKNYYNDFTGNIRITSGDTVLYDWDCNVFYFLTALHIYPSDWETAYYNPARPEEGKYLEDYHKDLSAYAMLYPAKDWSGITFQLPIGVNKDGHNIYSSRDGWYITAPADTPEELKPLAQSHLEEFGRNNIR